MSTEKNGLVRRSNDWGHGRDLMFGNFDDIFGQVLDGFFGNKGFLDKARSITTGYPKMDIFYTDTKFNVKVAVPGVDKDQLELEITEYEGRKVLRIAGEMKAEYKDSGKQCCIRELHKSTFSRSIYIPDDVDATKDPVAKLKDGILLLEWDKKAEDKPINNKKTIKIEV